VRLTAPDGQVTVYQSASDPLSPQQVAAAETRRMDCIDCHNRPSHVYHAPARAVNLAMSTGRLSTTLPSIKRTAVGLLTAEYDSTSQALAAIEQGLTEQYRDSPDTSGVRQAVTAVQRIYQTNFFPEMRVNWRAYPTNLGHTIFPGCYRCHDGKHRSEDGRVIAHSCTSCHIIIAQGSGAAADTIGPEGLEFQHPTNIGEMWRTVNCAVCHTGG
jgi:hypothetical protein